MSNPANSIILGFEPVRSLAAASITGSYVAVGTATTNPARQFIIQNLTDATLMFSFDGVNDFMPLLANGLFVDDITTNKTQERGFFLSAGTTLYVKRIGTPTTGSVYLSISYGIVI